MIQQVGKCEEKNPGYAARGRSLAVAECEAGVGSALGTPWGTASAGSVWQDCLPWERWLNVLAFTRSCGARAGQRETQPPPNFQAAVSGEGSTQSGALGRMTEVTYY